MKIQEGSLVLRRHDIRPEKPTSLRHRQTFHSINLVFMQFLSLLHQLLFFSDTVGLFLFLTSLCWTLRKQQQLLPSGLFFLFLFFDFFVFRPRLPNYFLFAASVTINPGPAISFLPGSESRVVTDDVKDDVCRFFVAPALPKHGLALIPTHRWSAEALPSLHHPRPRPPSHQPGSSSFSLMCCFVPPPLLPSFRPPQRG